MHRTAQRFKDLGEFVVREFRFRDGWELSWGLFVVKLGVPPRAEPPIPVPQIARRSDMEEVCVAKGFKRDWWAGSVAYSGVLHDEKTDNKIDFKDAVWRHLRTLPDGDVVEIIVRRTGERCPLGDDKWVLLRPHKYGPKSFLVKMTKVQEAKEEVAAALRQEKLALDALDAAKARLEDTIRSTRRAIDVARALRELFLSEWRARGWETEEENDEPV